MHFQNAEIDVIYANLTNNCFYMPGKSFTQILQKHQLQTFLYALSKFPSEIQPSESQVVSPVETVDESHHHGENRPNIRHPWSNFTREIPLQKQKDFLPGKFWEVD